MIHPLHLLTIQHYIRLPFVNLTMHPFINPPHSTSSVLFPRYKITPNCLILYKPLKSGNRTQRAVNLRRNLFPPLSTIPRTKRRAAPLRN